MTGFQEALQFLTVLRFKKGEGRTPEKLAQSQAFFPLVGALLGLILILLNKPLSLAFPQQGLSSYFLVIALIVLTGALHLDGLADTADALFSGKSREEKLIIMRDVHKGVFGVAALIIIITLKIKLISLLSPDYINTGLFFMTIFSRYAMNTAIFSFPYARSDGKARVFFEAKKPKAFLLATISVLILAALTLKWAGLVILILVILFTLAIGRAMKKAIAGMTGDTLGALCELNEIFVLILVILLSKSYM